MLRILKDIASDISLSTLLGFKGGTATMLFYDLPRFSVDLDFDLLEDSEEKRSLVFEKIRNILLMYGNLKDEQRKFSTIFFAVSYGEGEHQIKVEINTRKTGARYEMKNYLGIPMLVATKESLFAGKLVALTRRKKFVARDLYDTYFFLDHGWDIEEAVFRAYEVGSTRGYLKMCATFVESVPENSLLAGLGDLIDEKQKTFIKNKLKQETIFLLRARSET